VKSTPNPGDKIIMSGGRSLSPNEMLNHIKAGDELGRRLRRAIMAINVEFFTPTGKK
ncbi:unnamed protein product, partial [marine sediment metagenome]